MPSAVNLTAGGTEKITVAITPGVLPTLKKKMAGIRYTKAGIVCIKSSTGLIIASAILLLPANIPNGIPIIRVITVDTNTSVVVCTASFQ